jgi:CarboxypepD_reg-like domain
MLSLLRFFCTTVFIISTISVQSQTLRISGAIVDGKDNSSLIGVSVILVDNADTNKKSGVTTDNAGVFTIGNLNKGNYTLKCNYLGYKNLMRKVSLNGADINLGTLKMETANNELKNIIVEGKQVRAEQKEDTIQYHADAFKTHKDATAEDLVTKMPGVTSDNSGVKVNGENVQQVYVDGKAFFGNDPTLALRNLPSEVIDKIQVFDKLSDQSQFTGFDDGNSQKTMNIITRKNKSNGQFGKVYAGYGTDGTYQAGGNLNFFDGDRRITLLEMSNKILAVRIY